jgi:hypothetical protein
MNEANASTNRSTSADSAVSDALAAWVRERFPGAELDRIEPVRGADAAGKGFGYGDVVRLHLRDAPFADVVVHTARRGGFGHEDLADTAVEVLQPWGSFNEIPAHVRAVDVGIIDQRGRLRSMGDARDFYLVTAWGPGEPYVKDLERVARTGEATEEDLARVDRLAEHLANIHREKRDAPELYVRRLRDLVGHHECIAGLVDSYDGRTEPGVPSPETLRALEHWALDTRHQGKALASRLSRVHGDFHPWNILWDGAGFPRRLTLLDASRGLWGEPADDVAALIINYVFFSLRAGHDARGPFAGFFRRFVDGYLRHSGDTEVLAVLPPYYAWRTLVVASPVWYPDLDARVRAGLFAGLASMQRRGALALDAVDELFAPA